MWSLSRKLVDNLDEIEMSQSRVRDCGGGGEVR